MFRINVYVPQSHLEAVKLAMFNAGAGRMGLYDSCCWQTQGEGQFRPLAGSDAFIGDVGKLEKVVEYKLEMVCEAAAMKKALTAMLAAHPYEEAAYDVCPVLGLQDFN